MVTTTKVLNDSYDDNVGIIVIDPLIGEKEHYNSELIRDTH